MNAKIRWGIAGLGKIAHKFVADLCLSETVVIQGVASRDPAKARQFGAQYGSLSHYGSYEALANDPEVDVVYIATPHAFHFELTMICLKQGKAVLCEKPIGMNTEEVEAMIAEARSQNVFLMEGMWTRFIPATEKLIELLKDKVIGDIRIVRADFGFKAPLDPEGRLLNKQLGGGSLLDIGIYPIYLSLLLLGIPTDIKAMGRMASTGVDSYCSMLFAHEHGEKSFLESTFEAFTPLEAHIHGTTGSIKLHRKFHHSKKLSLYRGLEEEAVFELPYKGNGFVYEIEEVHNCLKKGKVESTKHPHQASLDLMKVMDRVKVEIGLRY